MSPGSQPAAPERAQAPAAPAVVPGEPIRVCHIDSGDLWAGAEVNTTTLLKALAARPELQLSAILLNEGEMSRRLRSAGIEVQVIPESEHGFVAILREATDLLRARPVSILHSHRYKENLLAALLVRRCGIPHLVCTRHGAPEPFRGWARMRHGAVALLDQLIARYCTDCVISLTDELRARLLRQLPPEKVVTIRTGVDTGMVRSSLTKTEAKRRLGIPQQAKVIGYAGRLVPVKRLDIFLHAAKQMAEADPALVFVIAGDGPEEARLRALAHELRLEGRVRFLGYRKDVYDVFRAFDVFVLCSDHEGLPRCVLEALHLGVPVVARAVGGVPEVIEDGVNGFLVNSDASAPLSNACMSLLADDLSRKRLAAAGVRLADGKFSLDGTVSEMAGLYRRLSERR